MSVNYRMLKKHGTARILKDSVIFEQNELTFYVPQSVFIAKTFNILIKLCCKIIEGFLSKNYIHCFRDVLHNISEN